MSKSEDVKVGLFVSIELGGTLLNPSDNCFSTFRIKREMDYSMRYENRRERSPRARRWSGFARS